MKDWEIIADNSARPVGVEVASHRLIPAGGGSGFADAHRADGKRFVACVNERLTAFLELESVIHRPPLISDRRKLDNFLFEIGRSFAFRDK